jgi:hypothetical protein
MQGAVRIAANIAVIILVAASFTCFGFGLSFYFGKFPATPQPAQGRIYPLNNHGYITYLTKHDTITQEVSFVLFGVLFATAALINHFIEPFDTRKGGNGRNRREEQVDHGTTSGGRSYVRLTSARDSARLRCSSR